MAKDVSVRLAVENERAIVAAFERSLAAGQKAGVGISRSFGQANGVLRATRGLMAQLGVAVSAVGLAHFGKTAANAIDDLGDLAQGAASSAKNFSALRLAGRTAGIEQERLAQALSKTASRVQDLRNGVPAAARDFGQLGLSAKDFIGLDASEAFAKISSKLGPLETGIRKNAIASDIWGEKLGRGLLPLINDLADEGLPNLIKRAREMGVLIDDRVVANVKRLNDNFGVLTLQIQSLAGQFISGLAPSLSRSLQEMSGDLGQSASNWERWGRSVALMLANVSAGLEQFGDIMTTFAKKASVLTPQGLWRIPAGQGWQHLDEEFAKRDRERQRRLQERRAEIIAGGMAGPENRPAFFPEGETPDASVKKAIEDRRKAEFEALQKVRELRGQHHAKSLAEIEREGDEFEKKLIAGGAAAAVARRERAAYVDQLRANAEFAERTRALEAELADLEQRRKSTQAQKAAGLITEEEAEKTILAVEKERLDVLLKLAQAAVTAAEATGNADLVRQARGNFDALLTLGTKVDQAGEGFNRLGEAGKDALVDLGTAMLDTAGDADRLQNELFNILGTLQRIATELLITGLLESVGGGIFKKVPGKAEGGPIQGIGTHTSDSNLIRASRGEFMVRAASASQPGANEFLEAFNRYGMRTLSVPRFADGGLVGATSAMLGAESATASLGPLNGRLDVGLDDGVFVRKAELGDLVVREVAKHRRAVSGVLGGR